MKKRMMLTGALLGASAFMLLSGFDSAETAESILEKTRAASADLNSAAYDVEMNADVTLDMSSLGMTMSASGSGQVAAAAVIDPMAVYFAGDFSGQALGQSAAMNVGLYMILEDDGTLSVYTGMGDVWSRQEVPADEAEQYTSFVKQMDLSDTAIPITYVLSEEAAEVDGEECYELTTSLTWEDVKDLIVWSSEHAVETVNEMVGEMETEPEVMGTSISDTEEELAEMVEQLDAVDAYMEGLQLNITMDISCETYETRLVYIDMDGSDWSNVIALLAESGALSNDDGSEMEANLEVKDLHIAIKANGPVDEIVVPEEVISAPDALEQGWDIEDETDQDGEIVEGSATGNSITFNGITVTFDETAFDYLYVDENYISGSLYDPYYSISARVNQYTDSEEEIRGEQEWDASYYAENFEKQEVTDVETDTYADGSTMYVYCVNYEDTEYEYAASNYHVYLLNGDGRCVQLDFAEVPNTMEEITLSREIVDELLANITIAWE